MRGGQLCQHAGQRRLARSGRAVDTHQPGRCRAGGRARVAANTCSATGRTAAGRSLTRRCRCRGRSAPCPRSGRRAAGAPRRRARRARRTCACRNHTSSPTSSGGRGRAAQRGLHLAGALEPGQAQAGRRPGHRGAVGPGRAGRDQAAAGDGGDAAGDGRRTTGTPEERRRQRGEASGSGRTAPGTSSPEPAVTSVTAGSAAEVSIEPPTRRRSRTPAPPPRAAPTAISRAAFAQLRHRRPLERAHGRGPEPAAAARRRGRRRPGPRRSSRRPARSPAPGLHLLGQREHVCRRRAAASGSGPTCGRPSRSPASTSMATRTGGPSGRPRRRPGRAGARRRPSA